MSPKSMMDVPLLRELKKRVIKVIQTQHYSPAWWGVFVNPFYIARKGLYKAIKPLGSYIVGRTLDIGCGQKPYAHLCRSSEYIGLELDTELNRKYKKADVFYDGATLPFDDDSLDSVVTHQVFEHIFTPSLFLQEIHRVLKTNGILMLSVPFIWDEHEQPYDFARYSSFGLSSLLKENGFEVILLKKSVNDLSLLFQLVNAYLYKKLFTQNGYWNHMVCLFIMAPITIFGLLLSNFPKNEDLYLDNIAITRKINISR